MLMSVTRIRYLLDQWRLRSAVGLHQSLAKPQPPSDWKLPAIVDPRRKPPLERAEGADKAPPT